MTASIGDVIRDRFGSLGTERQGLEPPDMVDGLPVDRTICPRCLGREDSRRHCHVCKGEAVCPTCRNGRVMSVAGRELRYVVCPDCCYDADQKTQTGVPMWSDNREGKQQAIQRYRRERRASTMTAPAEPERELVAVGADDDWSVDDVPF